MNRNLITAVLFIMLAIGGTLATKALAFRGEAEGRRGDCAKRWEETRQPRLNEMAEVLDLTAEQREQIEALLDASRETTRELRGKLRDNRDALRAAGAPEGFDEAKIRSLAAEGGTLKGELMVQRAKTRQQIHALLSTEQQQLLDKIRPLLGEGRGHHGRHHGPGRFAPSAS